jgi:hypothetical protein
MMHQLGKVSRKEIVGSTVKDYVKSIELFCEISDIN